jgi:hypothetical protein
VSGPATAAADLTRRLERYRAARAGPGTPDDVLPYRRIPARELAERLAAALDGEIVTTSTGSYVRVDGGSLEVGLDRRRLSTLPGHPPPDRPLVCLDTETTGLATATGTVAFLIGLGWWEGRRFRQVQLLLPDHADEPALLDQLARHIPADAWLVSYNGRGFDWPLLVTRYRLARRSVPAPDGHLDLLPVVRRLFRHRMDDARLRTVERDLLGTIRHDDVDGWEIPGRYLGFLRGGPAAPLVSVVRHNDEDVRSLALLLALLDVGYASADARRSAPSGDLAGLARAFTRAGRPTDALACLDAALERASDRNGHDDHRERATATPWWSPGVPADFGGRAGARLGTPPSPRSAAFAAPWDVERIAMERARLLRRLGRHEEAAEAWAALAAGPGRAAIVAAIELARVRERRLKDPRGALAATTHGLALAERRHRLGRPEPSLEADLRRRAARLRRRVALRAAR